MYIYIFYILSVSYCSIQVGTFAHLKNFRQGLRYQLTRCQSQHAAATASEDAQAAQEARHRLAWIYEKHLVPIDLLCCQKAPGVVLQAAILQLPPEVPGRFVVDHLVLHVEPPLLFEDPRQTVSCLLCCRGVTRSCCSCELGVATRNLVTEALAKILQVGERTDLNTTVRY